MEKVSLVNVNREGQVKPQLEIGRKPGNERRCQLTGLAFLYKDPLLVWVSVRSWSVLPKSTQQ